MVDTKSAWEEAACPLTRTDSPFPLVPVGSPIGSSLPALCSRGVRFMQSPSGTSPLLCLPRPSIPAGR